MAEESDGTNSYFKLIGGVKKVLDEGTLLVADEMDAHLHPLLTKHLVSLFNSVEFNPNGAQLLCQKRMQTVSYTHLEVVYEDGVLEVTLPGLLQ